MHVYKGYTLPYTICFCVVGDTVLLIKRKKEPYTNQWNGLGGKIEEGEDPEESAIREVMEEASLDVPKTAIKYAGIITWDTLTSKNKEGMYAYAFGFLEDDLFAKRETREGLLEWKSLSWIIDKNNKEVARNMQDFLPAVIHNARPMHYHCEYTNPDDINEMTKFEVRELDTE